MERDGKTSFLIFGDSHTQSLRTAAWRNKDSIAESGWPLESIVFGGAATRFYKPFFSFDVKDGLRVHKHMIERFSDCLCNEDGVFKVVPNRVLLLSLGSHTQTFLMGNRWLTHKYWPLQGGSGRNVNCVSDGALRAMFLGLNQHIFSFVAALVELGQKVEVISCPPPSNRFSFLELGYSLDDLILIDKRLRDISDEAYTDLGVKMIPPPAFVEEGGIIKTCYQPEDLRDRHHGNPEYGWEMLKVIAAKHEYKLE